MTQPTDHLTIGLAQLNPTVGDLEGNACLIVSALEAARQAGADLVVVPELFLTGYPPEDLVRRPAFAVAARSRLERLARELEPGTALLAGTIWPDGDKLYNAVALIEAGSITAIRAKVDLPNYGVFDEKRVFDAGPMPGPVNFRGVRLGVPVCEDIWKPDVCECLAETGAEILIVPNGSPFDWKKPDVRQQVALARVVETGLPLAYVNQVGGQDELVFDGGSFVLNSDRSLALQMPAWQDSIAITRWARGPGGWRCAPGELAPLALGDAAAYAACVAGTRDYVEKNGFKGVVLGLSGGIDSALVLAIAVDALGADRVRAVMLPYRYTSEDSQEDATACAKALGVRLDSVPIEAPVAGFLGVLEPYLAGGQHGITEENIQSRARGLILMAISNKTGALVLTTGNKSEMSVGYATLYGDMNGGFNPIKDLYKTEVYRLSRWRNGDVPVGAKGPVGRVIPERVFTKAPTAELRPGQTDQDSLPPYAELDAILAALVEEEASLTQIVARGYAPATVTKVARLLRLAEYKRRQAAPGVKISARNFGRDRRYPITNKFSEPI